MNFLISAHLKPEYSDPQHVISLLHGEASTEGSFTINALIMHSIVHTCTSRHLKITELRVVGHGYCAALKECADMGFVVNY